MRDRLMELLKQNCHCKDEDCSKCSSNGICFSHREADYLLENGVIVPPCKVGDTVFRTDDKQVFDWWQIEHIEIYADEIVYIDDGNNKFTVEDIGKTVFLTKEEAEQALSKLQASYEQGKEGGEE